MTTERGPASGQEGFTLIEVLVAMLILSAGLLSLEALGIGAARAVAMADRQSEFATIATSSLEEALEQLRVGVVPNDLCEDAPFGARLSRDVDLTNANRPTVTVTVFPDTSDLTSPRAPFAVRSAIFRPTAIAGASYGSPCP